MSTSTPMGCGFFIFFQDLCPEDGGTAYDPTLERRELFRREQLSKYEAELKLKLDKENAKALNEKKVLQKEKVKIAEKLVTQQDIRQKQEIELKLTQISESLLMIEKDLAVIKKKRAKIEQKARILRDDDEAIMLLMYEGYL